MSGIAMELSHSQEQYLRVIYELSRTKTVVFQVDVVRMLGRSKPSVCRAVALLRRKGLLEPECRELVLTAEGLALEQRLHRAREQMRAVLERLGVPPDVMDVGMEETVGLLSSEDFGS